MSMILIFDLDDTLYPERTFVESGFHAVAVWLQARFGWDTDDSVARMMATLAARGRGAVFDDLLSHHGVVRRSVVRECVKVYRHHRPRIELAPKAHEFLAGWTGHLYLVTDGHKVVQHNKVVALGLQDRFDRIYITHRHGTHRAKPSPYCFERIHALANCAWEDMVYVGDNPAKDFVALNRLGGITVRVMTGEHREVVARPGYDARYRIDDLGSLGSLLQRIASEMV